jgi:hypothetical protein
MIMEPINHYSIVDLVNRLVYTTFSALADSQPALHIHWLRHKRGLSSSPDTFSSERRRQVILLVLSIATNSHLSPP